MNGENLREVHPASHINGSVGFESYFKTLPASQASCCTLFPFPSFLTSESFPAGAKLSNTAHLGQETKAAPGGPGVALPFAIQHTDWDPLHCFM